MGFNSGFKGLNVYFTATRLSAQLPSVTGSIVFLPYLQKTTFICAGVQILFFSKILIQITFNIIYSPN